MVALQHLHSASKQRAEGRNLILTCLSGANLFNAAGSVVRSSCFWICDGTSSFMRPIQIQQSSPSTLYILPLNFGVHALYGYYALFDFHFWIMIKSQVWIRPCCAWTIWVFGPYLLVECQGLQPSISVGVNFEVASRSFRHPLLDVIERRVRQMQIGREFTAVSTMRPQVVQMLVDAALFISGMTSFHNWLTPNNPVWYKNRDLSPV